MNQSSRELNDAERAKLNELIVANKALLAPLDDDITNLVGDECKFKVLLLRFYVRYMKNVMNNFNKPYAINIKFFKNINIQRITNANGNDGSVSRIISDNPTQCCWTL